MECYCRGKRLRQKYALMILDEPTNHMDLDSIIVLEDALSEYEGALVLISHDELFLQAITTEIWRFIQKDARSYMIREEKWKIPTRL